LAPFGPHAEGRLSSVNNQPDFISACSRLLHIGYGVGVGGLE
jgi:hypothetical protein